MTGREAAAYIHAFQWKRHAPDLDRIRTLLRVLGPLYFPGDVRRAVKTLEV